MDNGVLKSPVNGWDIKPAHEENEHRYLVDGELMPSVTTVLKVLDKSNALMPWAAGQSVKRFLELLARKTDRDGVINLTFAEAQEMGDEARKKYRETSSDARDIGSTVHAAIEAIMLGQTPEPVTDESVANGLIAFTAWRDSVQLVPFKVEAFVASKKHKVAGMVDCIGTLNGKKVVLDWKVSTGLYPEYLDQVSAYTYMLEEMLGKKLDGAAVVRFNKKDGSFNPKKDFKYIERPEVMKRARAFFYLAKYYHVKADV